MFRRDALSLLLLPASCCLLIGSARRPGLYCRLAQWPRHSSRRYLDSRCALSFRARRTPRWRADRCPLHRIPVRAECRRRSRGLCPHRAAHAQRRRENSILPLKPMPASPTHPTAPSPRRHRRLRQDSCLPRLRLEARGRAFPRWSHSRLQRRQRLLRKLRRNTRPLRRR